MKSKLLLTLLTCACASLARADFNPVALTPSSYTFDIVVPASTVQALPFCINVTAGNGTGLGDNTYYEQGLRDRPGNPGANSGVPPHNTTFLSVSNANITFLMPPDYTQNNDLMIDSVFSSGTLTFTTPTTATNLAILCAGGGGALSVHYIVTHADSTTDTGTLNLLDWFSGGATVAWGANGRITSGGGYNNYNSSPINNQPPFLYNNTITVSGTSPVVSIEFDTPSGNHGNFFAVSGNASGPSWTPIPLDPASFNVKALVPATIPFPVNATMDQGTNLAFNGNLATWFEQGYDRAVGGAGLPPANTPFNSFSQPTHHYQFASYTGNNAILIDTNHQVSNITLATPAAFTGLAFLTAGGNEGSPNIMSNICVIQHQDGVNETNEFLAYDWFDQQHNGAIALEANGRVNLAGRSINNVGNQGLPYLFETYFILNDTLSPVTNIVVKYHLAPNGVCTTYVMGVSATTDGVPALVSAGPVPTSQSVPPGTNITFTVGVTGTQPISGFWQVDNGNGFGYVPLTDGTDANGSIVSGSQTLTLSITNVQVADSANYQFVAGNAFGTNTSPVAVLTVNPEIPTISPANPTVYTGNNVPLSAIVTAGPAVNYQWFVIDNSSVSNIIAGATSSTYTIPNVNTSMSGYTYGVTVWNSYGTNSASTVLSVSDSSAFLAGDLAPVSAEAYSGSKVTYSVVAQGNTPIYYQWTTNGVVVTGLNSNRLSLTTPCGITTVQVSFSNALSGGVMVNSSTVQLQGDGNPLNLGFNTSGTGWQTNGTLAGITNNTLLLTDGNGGEASSAFYTNAQYVGGNWNASYIYNSHGGGADGTAFVLQTTNPAAIGGGGGQLGYTGIAGNSLAYEINIYNGGTIGGTLASNGATGTYQSVAPVNVAGTNDILVNLSFNSGVLTVTLTDQKTSDTFTTNYNVGSLVSLLGGNLAYIGFSGGDGGVASVQTVRNFQFHTVLPPVALSMVPASATTFNITWPNADPSYVLQTNSSLTNPSGWAAAPAPTTVNGTNTVIVTPAGGGSQLFYRLLRVGGCP
jgi:hypothetical protein